MPSHHYTRFGKMILEAISLFAAVSLACSLLGRSTDLSDETAIASTVATRRGTTASTLAPPSPAAISPTVAPSATLQSTDTPLTPTPTPLVIQDKAFGVDYEGDCDTDIRITGVEEGSLQATGVFSMRNGQFTVWCYGAKHTWLGTLVYGGYTFTSDAQEPLQFTIRQGVGYVYSGGKGVVTLPDGSSFSPGGTSVSQALPVTALPVAATSSTGGTTGNILPASKQPFQVGEITLQIDQVEYGKLYGGMFAPADMTADQTVLTVVVDVLPGMDENAISKMGPWVSDPAGVHYPLGTGLSHT